MDKDAAFALDLLNEKANSFSKIKTFNMIKNAIWACTIEDDKSIPRSEMQVDLVLLRDLLQELKIFIEYFKLTADYEYKLRNGTRSSSSYSEGLYHKATVDPINSVRSSSK